MFNDLMLRIFNCGKLRKTVGYQTDSTYKACLTQLFEPYVKLYSQKEPITLVHNDDNNYNNDNEFDDNGGDDDNGQNLFDMASTLRTWRKSPLL